MEIRLYIGLGFWSRVWFFVFLIPPAPQRRDMSRLYMYSFVVYQTPFYITEPVSNNAFSFDKREKPKLYVPSLIQGDLSDIQIGDEIVFEDYDDEEELKSCVGLKHFVRLNDKTVVVDNHNHVFYFWFEARERGLIDDGATLIHIDQHKDMRIPEGAIDQSRLHQDLETVFEYTNTVLNVGNYIIPAQRMGLIDEVIMITGSPNEGATPASRLQGESIILNIDLDYFAPEMDYIDYDSRIQFIRKWMEKADLITIATSPFFVDQKRAIEVLGDLEC